IDEEVLLPLIEQYIASLPAKNAKDSWRDVGLETRAGEHCLEFAKKLQTPKATVYSHWSGDVEYNLRNSILRSAVIDIMKIVYTEKIREEEGGTYGVRVDGSLSRIPRERFSFSFSFDTDAPLVEPLLTIANAELKRLQTEGPSEENWQKVKEFLLKKHAENLEENGYWHNSVLQYHHAGIDTVTDYVDILNAITTAEIRDFAKRLFSQENNIKVIQLPEK
ncbi:MAG: insulinase family protein, partial [Prevotellaceae bacterium]|nr:insulinase family protein [Prevotellaceae bacterium]